MIAKNWVAFIFGTAFPFLEAALSCADLTPTLYYKNTTSKNNYQVHYFDLSVDLTGGYYIGGSYGLYKSDFLNLTKSYFGYGGWSGRNGSVQLSYSWTPEVADLYSTGFGINGSFCILQPAENEERYAPIRIFLLGGIERIFYKDGLVTTTALDRQGRISSVQSENAIHESDYTLGTRMKAYRTTFTLKYTGSRYDSEPYFKSSFDPLNQKMIDYPGLQQSYPQQILYARVSQDLFSRLWVYGSCSETKYQYSYIAKSDYYLGGIGMDLKYFDLSLEYSRYLPSAGDSQDYISLAGSMRLDD